MSMLMIVAPLPQPHAPGDEKKKKTTIFIE